MRRILYGRNPKATLWRVVTLAAVTAICVVILEFILLPIRVEGISMWPTYKDRSLNLVNRLAYLRQEPQRGDVVAIRLAGKHAMYMKRIIGLPGETVAFAGGKVLINGQVLDEPYEQTPCDWDRAPVTLSATQYFVVGDNRTMPQINHTFGECERERILGRILL